MHTCRVRFKSRGLCAKLRTLYPIGLGRLAPKGFGAKCWGLGVQTRYQKNHRSIIMELTGCNTVYKHCLFENPKQIFRLPHRISVEYYYRRSSRPPRKCFRLKLSGDVIRRFRSFVRRSNDKTWRQHRSISRTETHGRWQINVEFTLDWIKSIVRVFAWVVANKSFQLFFRTPGWVEIWNRWKTVKAI